MHSQIQPVNPDIVPGISRKKRMTALLLYTKKQSRVSISIISKV